MKKYRVTITETLATSVEIEAESESEAMDIAEEQYHNEDIVLTAENYVDTDFSTKEIY